MQANGKAPAGESDNVFKEFKHSLKQLTPKKMLGVVMEKEMLDDRKWTGSFGMNLAGRIFVDFSGDLDDQRYLSTKIGELKRRIEELLHAPAPSSLQTGKYFN